MFASIPFGQFVGSTIEHALLILGGAYVVFLRPRRTQRLVARGKIKQADADVRLKKFRPVFGYILIFGGAILMVMDFLDYRS